MARGGICVLTGFLLASSHREFLCQPLGMAPTLTFALARVSFRCCSRGRLGSRAVSRRGTRDDRPAWRTGAGSVWLHVSNDRADQGRQATSNGGDERHQRDASPKPILEFDPDVVF